MFVQNIYRRKEGKTIRRKLTIFLRENLRCENAEHMGRGG